MDDESEIGINTNIKSELHCAAHGDRLCVAHTTGEGDFYCWLFDDSLRFVRDLALRVDAHLHHRHQQLGQHAAHKLIDVCMSSSGEVACSFATTPYCIIMQQAEDSDTGAPMATIGQCYSSQVNM